MAHITGMQLRAARALIGWRAEDVAKSARIGVATVRRAERSDGPVALTDFNAGLVRRALERAGIVFLGEDENHGPGVRTRKGAP